MNDYIFDVDGTLIDTEKNVPVAASQNVTGQWL